MTKPTLCLDFDGVCHSYTSGWQGIDVIPDEPVEGLDAFLSSVYVQFDITIFSSRSATAEGRRAMAHWFTEHFGTKTAMPPWWDHVSFPDIKPPAMVTLDDRAVTFNGEWPGVNWLLDFRTWQERV